MNTPTISLLQKKHPDKILAALDHRSAEYKHAVVPKDIPLSTDMVRARKARSRDTITLCRLDQELEVLFSIVGSTLYYMPSEVHEPLTYRVTVEQGGEVLETVAEIARVALCQSLKEQGSMRPRETRVFTVINEQPIVLNEQQVSCFSRVHLTVLCDRRTYQVAAELGRSDAGFYTTMLSLALPHDRILGCIT